MFNIRDGRNKETLGSRQPESSRGPLEEVKRAQKSIRESGGQEGRARISEPRRQHASREEEALTFP